MEESGLDTVFYIFTIVPQVAGKLLKIIKSAAKLFYTIKVSGQLMMVLHHGGKL
jgi:hypothetical protein